MSRIKDKIKSVELDFKKFLWYVFTEPLRMIWNGVIKIGRKLSVIQRIQSWNFIFLILMVLSILTGNVLAAKGFSICFIISLLHYEWQKGLFRKRWKDKERRRIEKIIRRKEAKENERINSIRERQPRDNIGFDSFDDNNLPDREKDRESDKELLHKEESEEIDGTKK